jgi:alpha/beta superfamily hydrolase
MSAVVEAAAPSNVLTLFETRALPELGAFWLMRPWLSTTPRGDGHPVLVLPGLLADDLSTKPLRDFLKSHGYRAHGWKLGHNRGLRARVESDMGARLDELFARYDGRKVSLVGWSLGGLYARQLAKRVPEKVRCVITLGSPFAGSPSATHAWRAYEWASGSTIDTPSLLTESLAEAPPVPTTSIFSRTDGICAWQTCVNAEGPEVENIEVNASHFGLGHHPAAVYAVADRLAQPEGTWKKFDRTTGWRPLTFPG